MNLINEFNKKEIELLSNAGVRIENKEYSAEELQRCEDNIVGYIMSHSSKNGDIGRLNIEYDKILSILSRKG